MVGEGRRKIPHNIPQGKTSHRKGGGGGGKKNKCCPMVAAVQSAKDGNFRLARRYAVMGIRRIAGVA